MLSNEAYVSSHESCCAHGINGACERFDHVGGYMNEGGKAGVGACEVGEEAAVAGHVIDRHGGDRALK
eukprot:6210207-Pleurochrysis_carterae.AAC.3